MPDPQPKPPTPLKRFALQRPTLAPPGTVRIDATPPPPNFSPWQLWGQGLLEAVVDPVRGALWGPTGPEDTLAAKGAETVMAGLPLVAGVKSLMAGRGLYSRVDEALKLLPKKGAHPNKIASILKNNASVEELAYRGVPEFLASKGNATVTPADLAAHLAAHPAPVPVVKTRGGGAGSFRVTSSLNLPDEAVAAFPRGRVPHFAVVNANDNVLSFHDTVREAREAIEELPSLGIHGTGPATKFGQYTLPGGEQYRETLVTLPTPKGPNDFELQSAFTQANEELNAFRRTHPDAEFGYGPDSVDYRRLVMARNRLGGQLTASENAHAATQFRSGHFEEPNILVHTRANERTLPTGERGRFVEEVQSDWHQKGKKEGYVPANPDAMRDNLERRWGAVKDELTALGEGDTPQHRALRGELADLTDEWNAFSDAIHAGIPDAPFKETWPDLGLKQQVLETAADPHAEWIGFTSGQTQAARYDLSKQINRVTLERGHGAKPFVLSAYDHQGERVISQGVANEAEVADYIGKEPAQKLLKSFQIPSGRDAGLREITGLDLQVGGEGMRHFYDQVLPKRLEKIVKPFGGTVERAPLGARSKAMIDAEMDALHLNPPPGEAYGMEINRLQHERGSAVDDPAWIAKLTPEMKARILKEGLPLLSLTAFLSQMGAQPTKETR